MTKVLIASHQIIAEEFAHANGWRQNEWRRARSVQDLRGRFAQDVLVVPPIRRSDDDEMFEMLTEFERMVERDRKGKPHG